MWFIRAIFPIGAIANIFVLLVTNYWFGDSSDPPFARLSITTVLIYVLCLGITIKEALGFAVLSALLSSVYFLSAYFLPEYDFPGSGYAFTALIVVPLLVMGAIHNNRGKKAVKKYFLRREMGSLADVSKASKLSVADAQARIDEFIKSGELEVMIDKPAVVYRWTEAISYPEGMQSTVLDIEV